MAARPLHFLPAAVLLFSVGAVACGSNSSPTATSHTTTSSGATTAAPPPFTPGGGPTPTSGGVNGTYSVNVSVTGTDTVQGSFTQAVPGPGGKCPPPNQLSGSVSGQQITLQMPQSGSSAPQALSPGDVLLTIGSRTWGVASASNAPHGTSGMLQRNTDGSGSVQFQNLALQSNFAQQPQESGSVTWTCA